MIHDGKNIIFCKTDYLLQEFDYIRNLPNEVVLISGNSDYPITQDYFRFLPENVTFWFAENSLFNDPRLIPIPLGLECEKVSVRPGHGVGYPKEQKKKKDF